MSEKLAACKRCDGAGRKRVPCKECHGSGFDTTQVHWAMCRICGRETRSFIETNRLGHLYCGGCRVMRKGYYL